MKVIQEVLQSLGDRVNLRYPNINIGGCAVFAAIVGKELEKLSYRVHGVVLSANGGHKPLPSLNRVRLQMAAEGFSGKKKEHWNYFGLWFNHVCLSINLNGHSYLYDTDNFVPASKSLGRYQVHPGFLSVKELACLAREGEGWNECFERNKIPALRALIQRHIQTHLLPYQER